MTENAAKLMQAARTALLLDAPFWGSLSLRLHLKEDIKCETAWVDGATLGFNPEFVAGLTPVERKGLIAHEVCHVANLHPFRRGDRDPARWNESCDHAINGLLLQAGFTLPQGDLCDPRYAGLSAEAIYGMLPVRPPGSGGGQSEEEGEGEGPADPGGCGEVRDAPGGAAEEGASETDWEVATLQAVMQAKLRGDLPAGLERLVARIQKPACHDLVAALLEFAARSAREDYSFRQPNRRYLAHGLYLPSLHSEQMPPITAAVDTSGSITPELLEAYVGALQVVLDELRPETLTVYACDAKLQAERAYENGDTLTTDGASYPGGGGTSFVSVFDRIAEGEEPACLIYLTDLKGEFPAAEPTVPTLWAVRDPYGLRLPVPFGSVIYLDE